jgi:hypothetical protein
LASEPDFAEETSALEKLVRERGHKFILLPKFHPELNFIEMLWGYMKRYVRLRCTYSFRSMEDDVRKALLEAPADLTRRFAVKALRIMDVYRRAFMDEVQLSFSQVMSVTRKYRSHRRIPDSEWRVVAAQFKAERQEAQAQHLEQSDDEFYDDFAAAPEGGHTS